MWWRGLCTRDRQIIKIEDRVYREWVSKSALSQHQERTGHSCKEASDRYDEGGSERCKEANRKVKESIQIKLRGISLNSTDGHDMPDFYLPLMRTNAWGDRQV